MVRIQNGLDISSPQRALMDSGAQCSLITEACVRRLNLKPMPCYLPLRGVGGAAATITKKVQIHLRPWFESPTILAVELFIYDEWQSLHPPSQIQTEPLPPGIGNLADTNFHMPAQIDLLLGAEVWSNSVKSDFFRNKHGALLQSSAFGYLALGRFALTDQNCILMTVLNTMPGPQSSFENEQLLDAVKQFWEWEGTSEAENELTPDEKAVEEHFKATHYRSENGRYVVSLPLKPGSSLGESRNIALRRFHQLERRLQAQPDVRQKYIQAMREEIANGYMDKAWG